MIALALSEGSLSCVDILDYNLISFKPKLYSKRKIKASIEFLYELSLTKLKLVLNACSSKSLEDYQLQFI